MWTKLHSVQGGMSVGLEQVKPGLHSLGVQHPVSVLLHPLSSGDDPRPRPCGRCSLCPPAGGVVAAGWLSRPNWRGPTGASETAVPRPLAASRRPCPGCRWWWSCQSSGCRPAGSWSSRPPSSSDPSPGGPMARRSPISHTKHETTTIWLSETRWVMFRLRTDGDWP